MCFEMQLFLVTFGGLRIVLKGGGQCQYPLKLEGVDARIYRAIRLNDWSQQRPHSSYYGARAFPPRMFPPLWSPPVFPPWKVPP